MTRRTLKRAAAFTASALLLGLPAEAYYHYVYYLTNPVGSYASVLMPARFDLNKLPNNTVTFSVNDSGPATLAPGDSFGSVLGEVKQALAAWNAVPTSALRISFGGIESASQNANTPGGRVLFTDLPPGIIGMGTPNLPAAPQLMSYPAALNAPGSQGYFIPIGNSLVMLTNNTNYGASSPGPSYLESYFTTAVHEIGHSLGLQHTWTGSAMSQGVIRNTSHARPLDADDIASLSELYGVSGWTQNYGSISGTVQFNNGQSVSLASVVAVAATGPAISALTNPDGSYTINGLPPNTYQVYVHPLPPDAIANGEGLKLPENQAGVPYQPSGSFQSQFYPGTQDPNQAAPFAVLSGSRYTVNFTVTPRSGVPAYDLVTYSYLDPVARNYTDAPTGNSNITPTPAFINSTQTEALVFIGPAQGVSYAQPSRVTMLGVGAAFQLNPFSSGTFAYFAPISPAVGPRHLVFSYANDMYVLPNAVNLVEEAPPFITSVNANGDGTVTVSGNNFSPDQRVFFDGLPAAGTFNSGQNSFTVTPPVGVSGQTSTITVFDSDSQNSMMPLGIGENVQSGFQPQSAQTYTYPSYPSPQIQSVAPAALPAGTAGVPYSASVNITGVNTQFVDGQVTVGFGTSDISVSRVWVLSPTQLIANVVVAPGAALGTSEISVISGFNVMTAPAPFQILAANPSAPLIGTVINPLNAPVLFPAGYGVIYGLNLGSSTSSVQVTLNGNPAVVQFAGFGQVNFGVPANFPIGPAVLNLNTGSASISLVVPIGNPPVTIQGASGASGPAAAAPAGGTTFYNPGDTVTVQVTGLDPTVSSNLSRVQVTVSGLAMPVTAAGNGQVQFALTQSFGGAQVPVVVSVDGSASAPFPIAVR